MGDFGDAHRIFGLGLVGNMFPLKSSVAPPQQHNYVVFIRLKASHTLFRNAPCDVNQIISPSPQSGVLTEKARCVFGIPEELVESQCPWGFDSELCICCPRLATSLMTFNLNLKLVGQRILTLFYRNQWKRIGG